ncbi:hypothetical protein CPC16_001682 [Podila verticillata]|nr:hypothetical protein CPC16_001682 [Podila verticillata]
MAANKPRVLLEQGVPINTAAHQLALLAITRIARQDPLLAAAIFISVAPRLTPQEQATGWAVQVWQQIAPNFDFYGQLATEELGGRISLPAATKVAEIETEMARMQALPGFQLAQHLYRLQFYFEGAREWNWTLRGMSDRQLLAAAELAQRFKLYDRAVNTAERTRQKHDFSLRYILPLREIMERNAKLTGLDVAWAYGLIRQESRFISDARSSVGAAGLMQLMPGTAQLVARKIGLGKISSKGLRNRSKRDLV